MECSEFKKNILEIFYKETNASFMGEASSHLESCLGCRSEWNQLLEIRGLFHGLPDLKPNQESIDIILTESRKKKGFELPSLSKLLGQLPRLGWNFVPVMVVLFFFISLFSIFHEKSFNNNPSVASNTLGMPRDASQPVSGGSLLENPFGLGTRNTLPYQDVALSEKQSVNQEEMLSIPNIRQQSTLFTSPEELKKRYEARRQILLESDADTLMMRGRRLKAMGRVDLALADFETITRFYPEYTYLDDVLMYKAQCYAIQGDVDKAIDSLEAYVQKNPTQKDIVLPMIDQLRHD